MDNLLFTRIDRQVDVEFDEGETYYHVIEPGEQTIYNLTINNTTPGPKDLVADTTI